MEALKSKSAKINYSALDALFSKTEKAKDGTDSETQSTKGPDTEDEEDTRVKQGYVIEEPISDYDEVNY